MIGTSTITIQAPRIAPGGLNLVMPMITSTTAESTAPMPLMNRPVRQPSSLWVMWCLAMPACDSVNDVNTPIAYSGIRWSTLAPVTITSTAAATANEMIPLENTRRWPRLVSWRGMKLSPAWKLARRGSRRSWCWPPGRG